MKTFKEFLLAEQTNVIKAAPMSSTKPMMTQYNPVYNINQQQFNPNRGASPLPGQDPTMAKINSGMMMVTKLLDPTGVLSYEDIPPAVDAFNKQPNPLNGLMMLLAFTAAIPLAGKIAAPLKVAAKAGDYKKVIQLTPYVAKKVVKLIEKNPGNLVKFNIPAETIQKAKQMVQTARAEDMIPTSIFKGMVDEFKRAGGVIKKSEDVGSSYYNPPGKQIGIHPSNRTRATFAHEFGHHLGSQTPGSFHAGTLADMTRLSPEFDALTTAEIKASGKIDNSVKDLNYWRDVAKEREANTLAIKKMQELGATPQQIAAYNKTMGPAFKTYKADASRDFSRLSDRMAEIMKMPPGGRDVIRNALAAVEQNVLMKPGVWDQLEAISKNDPGEYIILKNKLIEQELKQKATTDASYKILYRAYRKALATEDATTKMLKPRGVAFEKRICTFNQLLSLI